MIKRLLLFMLVFALIPVSMSAQELDAATLAKRAGRKNLTIKEWNTDAKSKTRWLDRVTTYDSEGRKIEQIEYASYGQKWRETYEYGENGRVVREVEYDDRDKPKSIRKYEYNADGTKKKQYNYAPNGRLQTIKVFEYVIGE
ncbi:MAG: hypothetical protein J6B97_02210 [Bacteroidales bacterium]|nr:hypothetical protein [Bacteroidales bacterium]MBO5107233.1 hypothetical protein [Bacteroidales bacterium]MBQ6710567.1 hypothetical protein [Bacteroidales bacterium]